MSFKLEDGLGFIGGAAGMVVLGLFAYWLMWADDADKMVDDVKHFISMQEKQWSQAGAPVKITYNDITTSGFPFQTKVRVLMPRLQLNLPEGVVQLSMNYLNFSMQDDTKGQMNIYYLPDGIVSVRSAEGKAQYDYFVHLSATPELAVRTQPAPRYSLSYQGQLVLDAQLGAKSIKLPWTIDSESEQWKTLPTTIHAPVRWLVLVLQQSMARR